MVASLPPSRGGRPRGNRVSALIFLIAVILIVSLYQWNSRQISAERIEQSGAERLCEVRKELGLELQGCEE